MYSRFKKFLFLGLLAWAFATPVLAANQAEDLFQKALIKESVERDPAGAIKLYQRVIDEPRVAPATAAEARLRIGICFEKSDKPAYAERVYQQIINQKYGIPSDIALQARTNLQRLETERQLAAAQSGTTRQGWADNQLTRLSFLLGPSLRLSTDGMPATGLSLGLRYRITPENRPRPWYLEVRGTMPFGAAQVANQTNVFDSQGNDQASLSFNYQVSFGLVRELPHGQQRSAIPEVGAGLALTGSKISYSNATSSGHMSQTNWSPYVQAGLHIFPDRFASLLLLASYISTPYPTSVDLQSPTHSQTFNFPSSLWDIGAMLQIKLGYFVQRPRP